MTRGRTLHSGMEAAEVRPVTPTQSGTTFDDWVRPHLPMLRRFAASLTSSPHDGDDLLQRALIRAWKRWETYDESRGGAGPWLGAVLRDQARQVWRIGASRTTHLTLEIDSDSPDGGAAEAIDIRSAIRRLPRRQREAVVLHYYVDLTMAEVADVMGCAPGTVKATIFAARAKLSRYLGAG